MDMNIEEQEMTVITWEDTITEFKYLIKRIE